LRRQDYMMTDHFVERTHILPSADVLRRFGSAEVF
jgi:hypothetical protein